jgi:hypothetical protein
MSMLNLDRFWDLRRGPAPEAALEIGSQRVAAAVVETQGGRSVIAKYAFEALPPGALTPSLIGPNVAGKDAVVDTIRRVLDEVGRPRRVGLILPDPVAKISLIRFAQLPARHQDLDQLVRWQVRKAAPFPIDEAQVSHVAGIRAEDGQEFIVSVARRSVVEEYEGVVAAAGAHAGVVDISTFNVINAVLAGTAPPAADWLLVHVASDYTSIAILRGQHLIFFRSRGAEGEGEGGLADLVHQTAMYYEDRLQGGGFTKVVLSGAAANLSRSTDADQIRRSLEERLGARVDAIDVRETAGFAERIGAGPGLIDTLAPLVGLLVRGDADAQGERGSGTTRGGAAA